MFPRFSLQRSRTAPTGYEKVRILFHSIRTAQLLSSLITGVVLIYFIWWLIHDHYATPWTFIVVRQTITQVLTSANLLKLITVSLLTVLFLTATIIFHYMTGLSPRLNIVLNSTLLCLWTMGFGMLSYFMSPTLGHYCNTATWENEAGVMVCRIYKALFTFTLVGLYVSFFSPNPSSDQEFMSMSVHETMTDINRLSTLAALALDIHIHRLSARFGRHTRLDNLDQKRRNTATRGSYTDTDHADHDGDLEGPASEAFQLPLGARSGASYKGLHAQGYSVPEAQFAYGEDTGYHGGHEERALN